MNGQAAGDISASFKARRRVEFRDTDAAGIAHFSAFLFWMESVEHEWLRAARLPVFDRQADGSELTWPRVSVGCDYRSAVRFGDTLDIEISVVAVGRSSVTYRVVFEHDARLVAEGRVVAVRCALRPGGRLEPTPVAADFTARLAGAGAGNSDGGDR